MLDSYTPLLVSAIMRRMKFTLQGLLNYFLGLVVCSVDSYMHTSVQLFGGVMLGKLAQVDSTLEVRPIQSLISGNRACS